MRALSKKSRKSEVFASKNGVQDLEYSVKNAGQVISYGGRCGVGAGAGFWVRVCTWVRP